VTGLEWTVAENAAWCDLVWPGQFRPRAWTGSQGAPWPDPIECWLSSHFVPGGRWQARSRDEANEAATATYRRAAGTWNGERSVMFEIPPTREA